MAIVTLSRQSGSLGDEIGMLIARRLGYTFFDRKEIEQRIIAKGFPKERLKLYDERKPSFLANFARFRDEYLHYLSQTVLEMARENNCVIMGRGAFLMLSDVPSHIALRFVSTYEERLSHIMDLLHISDEKLAAKTLQASDKRQDGFYKSYFKYDLHDPSRIHAIINTAKMSPDMLAEMIVSGIERHVTPAIEKAGENRIEELILSQKIASKLIFEQKLPIDSLWVRIDGKKMTLWGIASSSATVERAITIINTDFPGFEIDTKINCVQDFRSNAKRVLADRRLGK
ncbi:MAG: cytidylate kinase-like family protein [Treponema sp.]|nr:cytidylate kinase-like family protein [Treponema sp.]